MEQLADAVESAVGASFAKAAVLEQFIDIAQEISVEGISWKGEHHVLAVTDKVTTGAPHYVELGQHQPSQLPKNIIDEAVRQARLGVKALGIEYGAFHPELMIDKNGQVFVTEIGARMGGDFIGSDLVYLSTGYDFLKEVTAIP
jgi:biotin carboxylase